MLGVCFFLAFVMNVHGYSLRGVGRRPAPLSKVRLVELLSLFETRQARLLGIPGELRPR